MEFLVGDAAYRSEDFSRELLFQWGLHPVFPETSFSTARHGHLASTKGVPTCNCRLGKKAAKAPMRLEALTEYWDPAKRAKEGLDRGEWAPENGRLRWVCARTGSGGCGLRTYTKLTDDPRMHTVLPHAGPGSRAAMRKALLLRRNTVESVFAGLQYLGLGGTHDMRPKWADDYEHWWMVGLALLSMTAKRTAHLTRLYEYAEAEAKRLRVLSVPTLAKPNVGPGSWALETARAAREEWSEPVEAPDSWPVGGAEAEYRYFADHHELTEDELAAHRAIRRRKRAKAAAAKSAKEAATTGVSKGAEAA